MGMGQQVVHTHSFAEGNRLERPVYHIAVRGGVK
jgi:hypothetical protein